jgi:hypothetical protein
MTDTLNFPVPDDEPEPLSPEDEAKLRAIAKIFHAAMIDPNEMDRLRVQLWDAKEIADLLRIPEKAVYKLPIPRSDISEGRVRWRKIMVMGYIIGLETREA